MTRARGRALLALLAVLLAAAVLAVAASLREPPPLPPRPAAQRPPLLLLTSLPLFFSEDFSLRGAGSPALARMESRYRVVPISVTSPAELARGKLLLMAQPPAQTAENLVALDRWVRGGGRMLLLADPMLEWPSERPLGDPLRPPLMFADTGLLAHWGLRLDRLDRGEARSTRLGRFRVLTVAPGQLFGTCKISSDRIVADCRIGKGEAIVVADADFLGTEGLGGDAAHNLDGLLDELASLER